MYVTYATNRTILYLQNNTYLQCEIRYEQYYTLLTIQKLAILTYTEILTLKKNQLLALLTIRITYATKTRK